MPRPVRVPRSRLVRRLLALQVVTVLLTVGGLAGLAVWGAQRIELEAAGRLTGATAAALAGDPSVVAALARGGDVATQSARLQPLAERVRVASGTGFVVVMSPAGLRYSHSEPDRIGGIYQGTLAPARAGAALTEVYAGTLGPSVRTVVPVFSGGRVVGAVSVGVLQTRVSDLALRYLPWIAGAAGVALLVGVGLAMLLARRLRRQTLGLEPEEITAAYTHHDAVLHAVGEGLLVVDGHGRIVVVNAEARRLLGLDPDAASRTADGSRTGNGLPTATGPHRGDGAATCSHPANGATAGSHSAGSSRATAGSPRARAVDPGRPAGPADLDLPGTDPAVRATLRRGFRGDLVDEPALAGERVLLVNSRGAGPAAGPGTRVFTLRDRTELAGALRERDDARGKVAALSAQAHEFGNRMQTVLTLMELGDTGDATRAGVAAMDRSRGPGAAVVAEVLDPVLAALLADKAWTASESGTTLTVTDRHRPGDLPDDRLPWPADDLLSLAGNLVDNALEAVADRPRGSERGVRVTLAPDTGGGLLLHVADTGPGIPDDVLDELFTYGYSTRADGSDRPRGIGLALVDRITRRLGGSVTVSPAGPDGGTMFDVRLPPPVTPAAAGSPTGAPADASADAVG